MARRIPVGLALCGGLLLALTVGIEALPASQSPTEGGEIIVVLRPVAQGTTHAAPVQVLLERFAGQGLIDLKPLGIDGSVSGTPVYVGRVASGMDVAALLAGLARSPLVVWVEPNVPRAFLDAEPVTWPDDPYISYQPYYTDIGVVVMWARGLTGISETHPITVAVIDTGVDLDHPDIDGNLVAGYDFVEGDTVPQDEEVRSHGSMVAGVIAAETNNALGVAGIGGGDAQAGTPGLRIMLLRVATTTSSGLDCATSARAIDYAQTHGAQVINLSYGGEDPCRLEYEKVQQAYDAGIALVAGAGNNNSDAPFYPAAYGAGTNEHLVISVTGLYRSGAKWSESNYGPWVDVSAPGIVYSITKDGGYQGSSGTSFSTPLVSGLVGVLVSNCGWSRDKAIAIVLATADDVDDVPGNEGYRGLLGAGRINADRASAMVHGVYLPLILHHP